MNVCMYDFPIILGVILKVPKRIKLKVLQGNNMGLLSSRYL